MGTQALLEKLKARKDRLEELYKQKKEAFTKGELSLEEFRKFRKKLKRVQRRVRKLQARLAQSKGGKKEVPSEESQTA